MGLKAGTLLWNRMRINLPPGPTDIDTGLAQVNKSFADMSPGEPGFDDPSRIQVVPLAMIGNWASITHGEPYFDPATQSIHVAFNNAGLAVTINALFWNPHSLVGPGEADAYTD